MIISFYHRLFSHSLWLCNTNQVFFPVAGGNSLQNLSVNTSHVKVWMWRETRRCPRFLPCVACSHSIAVSRRDAFLGTCGFFFLLANSEKKQNKSHESRHTWNIYYGIFFFYNHYRIHVFMNQAIEKSDFVLNDILKKLRIKTLKHNKACC